MLLIGGFNATHDAHTHVDEPFFNLTGFHVLEGCVCSVDATFVKGFDVNCKVTDLAGRADNGSDTITDRRADGIIGVGFVAFGFGCSCDVIAEVRLCLPCLLKF